MSRFSCLEKLEITRCPQLGWIGDEPFSSGVKKIAIEYSEKLRSIPSLDGLSSLEKLSIVKCNELGWKGGNPPFSSNLKEIEVRECGKLCKIGEGLLASTSLTDVLIRGCDNLRSIPFNGGSKSLLRLRLLDCNELRDIGCALSASTRLEIERCPRLILLS
ncbi:hypothetical protein V6N13_024057 [Hibiscus sabdariffa]|uniref:Uncharacterized protein n=1 Tax=Hibiscus sabdariffa TaxID=183260 RepID=A0ABR1ZWN6_9ROSI